VYFALKAAGSLPKVNRDGQDGKWLDEVPEPPNLSITHDIPFQSSADMLVVVVVGLDLRHAVYNARHPLLVGEIPLAWWCNDGKTNLYHRQRLAQLVFGVRTEGVRGGWMSQQFLTVR
jgi:hypothetical protein